MSPPPPVSKVSSHHHHQIRRHHSNSFTASKSSSFSKKLMLMRSRSSCSYPTAAAHDLQVTEDSSFSTSHSLPPSSSSSSSVVDDAADGAYSLPLVARNWRSHAAAAASPFKFVFNNPLSSVASVFRSFFPALQSLLVPSCQWIAVAQSKSPMATTNTRSGRKRLLTGTFFGQKKGRVSFAVQETPRSDPILLLQLATPTSHLVKEMASGMVRILLECERISTSTAGVGSMKKALWDEPVWTMYCNGHKLGYATSRECTPSDLHVLSTVQSVSVGAGVLPAATPTPQLPAPTCPNPEDTGAKESAAAKFDGASGEIMYMRAKFDRVIGSRDSEAFYMINPDCTRGGREGSKFNSGGPELSIFLLRI